MISQVIISQEVKRLNPVKKPLIVKDSIIIPKDTISLKKDALLTKRDTLAVRKDSINTQKDLFFESEVTHTADSLIKQDLINNKVFLYKNANVKYKGYDLKAGYIVIDNKNSTIYAKGIDSLGNYSERPVFKQGSDSSLQDSIIFNFKTKKAKTWNLKTKQEGLFIAGGENKKYSDSIIFLKDIKITSSDKKNPDYYIRVNKAKFIKDSKLVAGWSQLVVADVPTPAVLPFAYFPLTKGSTSGFLIPTWNESHQQGYSLQNGGYYFAFNDYWDMAITGDIYTNGSWGIRIDPRYRVRYKYNGSLSFRYQKVVYSIKGFSDYSKRTMYNLSWRHSQDSKSSPHSRFSANVDLGSSKYYRESLNELDNDRFLQNTLQSSISYSNDLEGTPFRFDSSLSHSQNTNTKQINMTLPNINITMDRQYPFAGKGGAKKNAFQKIGVTYGVKGSQQLTTTDEDFLTKRMFKNAKLDVNHAASANTNIKLFKYFTLTPSANYSEKWFFKGINKTYDAENKKVKTDTVTRFGAYREYSGSVTLATNFYGMFNFKKGRIEAIRHVMRPSITYSYKPSFEHYLREVQKSEDPNDIEKYSPFEGGGISRNVSNGLNISISNNIEAKLRKKEDEEDDGSKKRKGDNSNKIKILNNLNISTFYNIAKDSMRWSPISLNTGTRLFKNKLGLTFRATLNPYALSATGRDINKFNIQNGGSLFRLTNANITANYSISSKELFGEDSESGDLSGRGSSRAAFKGDGNIEGKDEEEDDDSGDKVVESKLYRSKIPWNISFSYNLTYTNNSRQNDFSNNSVTFNGNIELTPKWKVGFSSGYDIKRKGITHTNLNFARDLDSWRMTFTWSPTRDTYYFFIGIKSSMLSDLKYDQRKTPDKRLF